MYLIPLFLIISFGNVFAGNISVYGLRNYEMSFDKTKIQITSPVINLKFIKEPCNAVVIEKFLKKVSFLENDMKLVPGHKEGSLNFKLNGKEFNEPLKTSKAKFIDSLPEELQRMKIEEHLRCKSDKNSKKDKKI